MLLMNEPSDFLVWSFVTVVVSVAVALVGAVWITERRAGSQPSAATARAAGSFLFIGALLGVSGLLAWQGLLTFEGRPPRAAVLILAMTVATILLSRSAAGRRAAAIAPLGLLVGLQAFRLPLEMVMHRAAAEGVMPVQMSYSGMNFDIVTGATAILIAAALPFAGRWRALLVAGWNLVGFALLIGIIVISWLSAPTPLRMFDNEPANVWITHAPFIWLPLFLVQLALFGHLVTFRALARHVAESRRGAVTTGAAA
jgi:hypothetical protein